MLESSDKHEPQGLKPLVVEMLTAWLKPCPPESACSRREIAAWMKAMPSPKRPFQAGDSRTDKPMPSHRGLPDAEVDGPEKKEKAVSKGSNKYEPQGLKPPFLCGENGMAKAMPSHGGPGEWQAHEKVNKERS
jgi:hypothetical protein